MVAVFILVSIAVGLTSAVAAFFMGAGILGALGWYVAGGSIAMIALPVFVFITRRAADRLEARAAGRKSASTGDTAGDPATARASGLDEKMRILAVDDDPFVLELVPKIAMNAGFPEVTTVSSGAEALDAVTAGDAQFDCLLLDIKMPEMDGIELCRRLRAIAGYEDTPIIMLTAMRDLASMSDAYQAGASDYATKPFEIEEVAKRLQLANASNIARAQQEMHSLPKIGRQRRAGGLVTERSMASYLTRLNKQQLEDVHVYALATDERAAVSHDNLAAAAARCFGRGLLLAGKSEDDHLLLIVDATHGGVPDQIESEITRQVAVIGADQSGSVNALPFIALGGPVVPSGSREGLGRLAIDRAIVQATSRLAGGGIRRFGGLHQG